MGERISNLQQGLAILEGNVNSRLDIIRESIHETAAKEVAKLVESTDISDDEQGTTLEVGSVMEADLYNLDKSLLRIEEAMSSRVARLEEKVDAQFNRLFSMMQEIVAGMKT